MYLKICAYCLSNMLMQNLIIGYNTILCRNWPLIAYGMGVEMNGKFSLAYLEFLFGI